MDSPPSNSPTDGDTTGSTGERPSDRELLLYINDLELTLAEAGVAVATNAARLAKVRAWIAHYGARAVFLDSAGYD